MKLHEYGNWANVKYFTGKTMGEIYIPMILQYSITRERASKLFKFKVRAIDITYYHYGKFNGSSTHYFDE